MYSVNAEYFNPYDENKPHKYTNTSTTPITVKGYQVHLTYVCHMHQYSAATDYCMSHGLVSVEARRISFLCNADKQLMTINSWI